MGHNGGVLSGGLVNSRDELDAVRDAISQVQPREVGLHAVLADRELFADLPVAVTLTHMGDDHALALRELRRACVNYQQSLPESVYSKEYTH
jgi:hypothetical protein